MIIHNVAQGTPEWLQLRLGIPTASEFFRILSPTGKASAQAEAYMHRLLAEWVLGVPLEDYQSQWMIRGKELEQQAVDAYEFATGNETEVVGFVTNDAGTVGCSPDRLVKPNRGLELKCPAPHTHVGYLLAKGVDETYKPQVQGCTWLCETDGWDVSSYCPGFPASIIPVGRDEKYIAALSSAMDAFLERMFAARERLAREYGLHGNTPALVAGVEQKGDFDVTDEDTAAIFRMAQERNG